MYNARIIILSRPAVKPWGLKRRDSQAGASMAAHPPSGEMEGGISWKRGTKVNVIDRDAESTEILVSGKHWFADE
jgi:hypothetical protein